MPANPIVPDDLRTRLLRVRGIVFDVDGVLTDGTITFDEDGREFKSFDAKDGLGLVLLRDLGYRIGIISSRVSKLVAAWGLHPSETVAVGDDLPDLGMLRRAGIGACPSDAVSIVREAAALLLTRPGGHGAVREMCDLILEVRRGGRADRPTAVPAPPPESDGDVIPFRRT